MVVDSFHYYLREWFCVATPSTIENNMNFSIEKPLPISINSSLLLNIDKDDNWVSQLKIDEHRSFIIIDNADVQILGWRGNTHHRLKLSKGIERKLVLDGGIIKTTIFRNRPMIYAFDVLLIDDKRITMNYKERFNFIINNPIQEFTYPELIKNPVSEFHKLKNKESTYVENLSKELRISLKEAYHFVEGFVIKNNNGILRYPKNKCESPNQLKLKLF